VRSVQHPGNQGTFWWTNIMNLDWWRLTLEHAARNVG